jgi:hypothetical protein
MSPDFGQRLRDYLEQTGMMSTFSEDDLASFDAALSAINVARLQRHRVCLLPLNCPSALVHIG